MSMFARYALIFVVLAGAVAAMVPAKKFQFVRASSGTHLWWISTNEGVNQLLHHAATEHENYFQIAGQFDDKPTDIAADGEQVWVVFESVKHKMEVVSGRTQLNPASELWFIANGGALQLCPSIQGDSLDSIAAIDGQPWVIVTGEMDARCLREGQWKREDLPAVINTCYERMLVSAGGVLNVLGRVSDGSIKRFKWQDGQWIPSPLNASHFVYAIDHSARFACVIATEPSEQKLYFVEAGELVPLVNAPSGNQFILGIGEGFVALGESKPETQNTTLNQTELSFYTPGANAFMEPMPLRIQESKAGRWFHLPILGVLSLAAIIGAFLAKAFNTPFRLEEINSEKDNEREWFALDKWRRMLATGIDVLPCALVALVIFNGNISDLLVPPLWSTDIQLSFEYITMVAITIAFSMLEEIVFGRSMGKRIMGGRVVKISGQPAAWWQHIVRNLLKGLVLLSPILAIPSLLSPFGLGIPEIISRTAVVTVSVRTEDDLQEYSE